MKKRSDGTKRPKTAAERKERIAEILLRLNKMYPDATCALLHNSPWELLVATILSAQCTDKRVNMVTPELFRKYPTPRDFAAVRPEVLADDIRSTGFFNNKEIDCGRGAACDAGIRRQGSEVHRGNADHSGRGAQDGKRGAGTAYGIASGIVVDTHVSRIAGRLDLTKQTDPVKIEQDLVKIIPQERWIRFSHQIILHGRALCTARSPVCGSAT